MKLIPAIDLKDGNCVRLSEGKKESFVVYSDDPIKQAKFFENEGCQRIHIVDLDAAFGHQNNNHSTILDIRNSISIDIELGGGIRTEKDVSFWFNKGINYLIVGSFAINNPIRFKKISEIFLKKIYVSIDDNNGNAMIHGWIKKSNLNIEQVLDIYNNSKVKGFVFTDITRDGMLKGINIDKIKYFLKISKKPFIVGGGLSNNMDLVNLNNLNNSFLEGVIAGKSFYLGKIDIKKAQKILK